MLFIITAAGLFIFKDYIQRGLQGQHRKAGESFGYTRQYNPGASTDCAYSSVAGWYSQACYNNKILSCRKSTSETCSDEIKVKCVTSACH